MPRCQDFWMGRCTAQFSQFNCFGGGGALAASMLSLSVVGNTMPLEEDVPQLFERLKISPGEGHLRDGSASTCVGPSHVKLGCPGKPL